MMKDVSFYREPKILNNNFDNDEIYLQVNCTGHSTFNHVLEANTKRRDYYLIYLHQGNLNIKNPVLADNIMKSGDLIIFNKNFNFSYYHSGNIPFTYYWVHFTGFGAADLLKECGLSINKIIPLGYHETIGDKFELLFDSFLMRDDFFDIDSAQALTSLLIKLGRCRFTNNINNISRNNTRIYNSLSYIHENINSSEPLSIKMLADMEFMSVSRYRVIFNQIMNMSPQNYIIMLRLNNACKLLLQTEHSIGNIAAEVGYGDQRYFSRIFNKKIGLPPSKYRSSRIEN